jgi:RNA polymerase sigma-70 factor, ECF subfamily
MAAIDHDEQARLAALDGGGRDTDARTVAALRRRDGPTLAALVVEHHAAMLRVARSYVADTATAEDVVQETWIAVLRGVDRFDGRAALKTWIFRILINRAKTMGVRQARVLPVAPPAVGDVLFDGCHGWSQSTEDQYTSAEDAAAALRAIVELPAAQRTVITLRDVQCWPADEVCQAMGVSDVNQRVLLHRARAQVRRRLRTVGAVGPTRRSS